MIKTMCLELYYSGGGLIKRDILYHGDKEEIARAIEHDENELYEFMRTRDDKGIHSFCFSGFMFAKEGICAAQLTEPTI